MMSHRVSRDGVVLVGELSISIHSAGGTIRVDWTGKSEDRDPEVTLAPILRDLLERAAALGARLEMHFEGLQFFNSSTITTVLRHVMLARERGITIRVVYDPGHRWQRIFFDALAMFDRGDAAFSVREMGWRR